MTVKERLVLSVGIGAYNSRDLPPLSSPVQDALSIAQTAALTSPAFSPDNVTFKADLNCRDLRLQLEELRTSIAEATDRVGLVLVYLSGHGMLDSEGVQYLVCKDYERMGGYSDAALGQYGIPLTDVVQKYVQGAERALVVFDACRRNMQLGSRDSSGLLDEFSVGRAIVAYSCAPNSLSFDGFLDGKGYLPHLIKSLFDPDKSVYKALEEAKQATQQSTQGAQSPQSVVFQPYLYENYYLGKAGSDLGDASQPLQVVQRNASALVELMEATKDCGDKYRPYQAALKKKQRLHKSLAGVLPVGPFVFEHEANKYAGCVTEGMYEVSTADFQQNLVEGEVCEACQVAAVKAFKKKRRTKIEVKVELEPDTQGLTTPQPGDARPFKRQRES